MRNWIFALLILAVLGGCHDHDDHDHDSEQDGDSGVRADAHPHDDHGHGDGIAEGDDAESLSFTLWSDRTELFVEFPPLVVGAESPFAAHVTDLANFQPVAEGELTVVLAGGGSPEERFAVPAPSVPGVFRPIATPRYAGRRRLTLRLDASGLSDVHDLGAIDVHANAAGAASAHETEGEAATGDISFLKEQQWPIEFATEEIVERTIRPSLRVLGTVRARGDGEARVAAPVAGRLAGATGGLPPIGSRVARGDVLAEILPRLDVATDVASLELATRRARIELERAQRQRRELEGLLADGAVAKRRVLDARSEEQQAEARLQAAERRLRQFQAVQRAGHESSREGTAVPSPIDGAIAAVDAVPGQFVEDGESLFHIIDLSRLWLELRVPEARIGSVVDAGGVWFQVEGSEAIFEVSADRRVAIGAVVDDATRTIPLIFAVDNPEGRLRVGMYARAHVSTGERRAVLALPRAAIVSDGGIDTVYVQVGGETFARRAVRLGARDRGYVEVLSGVAAGERVVIRGAYAVKLAASGGQVPAHGHAH